MSGDKPSEAVAGEPGVDTRGADEPGVDERGAGEPSAGEPSADGSGAGARDAAVPLVVRTQGSDQTLEPGRAYLIGRDPASDIVVEEPLVSWRHAVLTADGDRWLLDDAGSTNGTFADGQRVRLVEITGSRQVRLGH